MATSINLYAYQEPILFLATAGIVVPLFHRLRISPVLGFLAAGALLGPFGLGRLVPEHPWVDWLTFTNPEGTSRLAEFGVVFLLFTIGIELSWQRLRTLRRLVFGFGSLQVALCALAIGLFAFKVVDTITTAAIIGIAFALSSTAIVIPVLAEQKRLNAPAGRASFSALLFQDLAVAAVSGLSMALGAFIAGVLLSETEYRRAVDTTIQPFKGLLLGVFFVSVGMGLDLFRFLAMPLTILAVATFIIAVKSSIIFGLSRPFGLNAADAAETSLLLGPGGEFALVILGSAMAAGLVPGEIGQNLLLVTTLTMVAIPLFARVGRRLSRRLEIKRPLDAAASVPPPADEIGRVIVAGYGRVGRLVGDMLERHKVPYLAIDMDPVRVAEERRAGRPVYFGDGSYPELLRACGIDRARALVITLDTPSAIEAVVAAAPEERADITIVSRARDARHAAQLYDLGVDDAVPETIEASLQLSEAVLADIGVPMGLVIASIHERRDEFRAMLRASNRKRDPN